MPSCSRFCPLLSGLTALLAVFVLTAGLPSSAFAQSERTVERTLDLDADGRLTLETFSGSVDVSTWDRSSVRVEVRIEGDSDEQAERTRIRFEGDRRSRTVTSDFDDLEADRLFGLFKMGDPDRPETHYTVRMPREAELRVEIFSASVRVADAGGDVTVDGFSADIEVENIDGRLEADLYSGDLRATGVRGGVQFDSFSGDADVTFDAFTDDASFDTFSGEVILSLPEDAGFDLDSDIGMGDLASAFDTSGLEGGDDGVRGSVGGGGPRVRLETFSGSLTLCAGTTCPGS